jgi:flagellar motor switch/type III secretory pathway protein FliN
MTTRPFKLVNGTESQRLCKRLSEDLARWAGEWLSEDVTVPDVTVQTEADATREYSWTARQLASGAGIAVGTPADDTSLRLVLTGTVDASSVDVNDPVLAELEKSAIRALFDLLLHAAESTSTDTPSPQEYRVPGSGYVMLRCRFENAFELSILLWPKTVDQWLGQKTEKAARKVSVSRLEALDSQTVTLDVVVGEAEIAFEELRGLCEGVVIKLDRRLDQPLQLRLVGDGTVCSGHLGLNDDRRAVQVVTTG